ncbi:MAG: DUF3276 family protein, partial [Bacteroidaceae bacterium]|nr:DUF3276 family protein [Bacteroidaceae bacterium]
FLYKEDFQKFLEGVSEAITYIEETQGKAEPRPETEDPAIKIDMDF